eukprot:GFKZ01002530.1.p1 GENE.GFKZ01002530.1~~GFKZ01002530.1.p1  ORF type:complete len:271 (-),score=39.98 GFKZ01002530.1:1447-2259(-)
MAENYPHPSLLAFALRPLPRLHGHQQISMTAGRVSGTDPEQPPAEPVTATRPTPTRTTRRVETRPEVVGGLPLWFTVGIAAQVRRLSEMLDIAPFATRRREIGQQMEEKLANIPRVSDEKVEVPVGRALRNMANLMEEEIAGLRLSLETVQVEVAQRRNEVSKLRGKLEELGAKNREWRKGGDSEVALERTATQWWSLYMREQTRAVAAERRLKVSVERLAEVEKKIGALEQDLVKMAVMFTGLGVVLTVFIMESPVWSGLLEYMLRGGV